MAIYRRARETVVACHCSSSAKALARLSEHGRGREHNEEERMKLTEQQRAKGGAEEEE